MIAQNLIDLAKAIAPKHGLDPQLVCAIIEQESGGDQWAIRYEPAFMNKYVPVGLGPTESVARATSWGVMQVMGQTARDANYNGALPALCDPASGIEVGCTVLAKKMAVAKENTPPGSLDPGDIVAHGLQLWNGGGNANYAAEVLARIPTYQSA